MSENILVTGGAGFIGSHIVDALVDAGHRVRVLDNLEPQVHGKLAETGTPPVYLNRAAEFIRSDVRDSDVLDRALQGIDVVYHKAAAVGVGQSMYEIAHYVGSNTYATAFLLEGLLKHRAHIRKLIVASSMSIYGEGVYQCSHHGRIHPRLRPHKQLEQHDWEMHCPHCGKPTRSLPTNEDKPLHSTSIYAISKKDQEEMCLCIGRAYGIPTVALRYFNVYGPRQALSNPYTGIAAIFSARLMNNHAPLIFEDGLQTRDFVHVSDIVQANLLALQKDEGNYECFNVGTGVPTTVREVAQTLARALDKNIEPHIIAKFRGGDIRHCFADISKAQRVLGYAPQMTLAEGIADLVAWTREQQAEDHVEFAARELEKRGLTR